jgi:hypothetical protein
MRSASVVGVWVFELLANHRLSGSNPKKCGSVRIGDNPLRTRNSGLGFALDEWLALIATGTPQSSLLRGYDPVLVAGPRASMPIIFIIATALLQRETPGFTL